MTMPRTNWYTDHPPACTCKNCEERRNIAQRHGKLGRNAPCPCGSGKKYKKCHGG